MLERQASPTKITRAYVDSLLRAIQDLFLADAIPWIVGYSGGKDSTATLQLVWRALQDLPREKRWHKTVHVISTDTLVEQPIVAGWVMESLGRMRDAAKRQDMPIEVHRLTPRVEDTYWVNLIGRGYPTPRPGFRWCTDRLKISPSSDFITNITKTYGESILVLGTRKAESVTRGRNMERYEAKRIREWLSPNGSLQNSWVFSPIEDWTNDEVWQYLMQHENPWGQSNKDLLTMYRGASPDNECPLVVDTSTPSCGNSRFGCWVCTMVSKDKSMEAMIQNDDEKVWMAPLLEFRNDIASLDEKGRISDKARRDFRRYDGRIKLMKDGTAIHGPYLKEWREYFLRRLLEVEKEIREFGPPSVRDIRVITDDELREIRRIWVVEKHEFDDSLPVIYEDVTGKPYPNTDDIGQRPFGRAEWNLLKESCGGNPVYFELQASLLDIEQQAHGTVVPSNLLQQLEQAIRRCFYEDEDDAVRYQLAKEARRNALSQAEHVYEQSTLEFDGADIEEGHDPV